MDGLRKHDLENAQKQSLEQKFAMAADVMEQGIRLKLAALRASKKYSTEAEVRQAMLEWLCVNG